MRLTSRKDMIVGGLLVTGLLSFQMGAIFGADPPSQFYEELMATQRPAAPVRPTPIRSVPTSSTGSTTVDPAAPTPVTAAFIDQPAAIQSVRLARHGSATRVEITLGPGAAAPRLAMRSQGRQPTLAITGLDSAVTGRGDGLGLVNRWELSGSADARRLNLPLAEPASVERAFLSHGNGAERRLVLDLVKACPSRT